MLCALGFSIYHKFSETNILEELLITNSEQIYEYMGGGSDSYLLCKSGTCCGLFYGAKCFNFLAVLGLLDVMLYRFLLTYFNCFCLQFSGQCCNESDTQSFHLLLAFTVVQTAKPIVLLCNRVMSLQSNVW